MADLGTYNEVYLYVSPFVYSTFMYALDVTQKLCLPVQIMQSSSSLSLFLIR